MWPKLVRGKTIQLNQYVMSGYSADLDGDAMNFQIPMTPEAVEEAKRLMLPSQNLLNITDKSPNYTHQEDYVQGLYAATRKHSKKGRTQVFATMSDLKQAYARGEVNLSDDVTILKKS
jgi:DNA-directed RNA polymerase subunit beta'